ncbi:conserved unknown protein [Ectocarpus siliculosus]|uniref:RING-type domain-containing protein n=1 Tax=Ectocarpus siliculosus TaxID=2880 RepID=D7G6B8_ECTSI|nr:conserved unknown protein [Ectocarpus siliculosus]|eukprot:CBJ27513.1 conserved unknown protein [Ectocarpus siliculosus]
MSCSLDAADGALRTGIAPADVFILSRLNDTTSYFFTWFCKKYRIQIGPPRGLGGKEEKTRCPICLDSCTKSIELQCGHSFCRSCLIQSAANNMTSCALCRREQEIDPEQLRARFDEQRMLNLAQRLAIPPPPVRSRPTATGAAMSASEGACEEKEVRVRVGVVPTSTTQREVLFGLGGDVGAMSSDDLRRRWSCGVQTASSTAGAASSSELRSSWRESHDRSRSPMPIHSEGDLFGTSCQVLHGADSLSCSGHADIGSHFTGASPRRSPDSQCAGGGRVNSMCLERHSSLRIPPSNFGIDASASALPARGENTTPFETSDVGGLDAACLRKRRHEAMEFGDVGDMPVSELAGRLTLATDLRTCSEDVTPFETSDVGGSDAACLGKRWHEAMEIGDVGDQRVNELTGRLTLAADLLARGEKTTPFETSDVGGLDAGCLRKRWHEAMEAGDVGDMPVSELARKLAVATGLPTCTEDALSLGRSDVGSLGVACLRKLWLEAMEFGDVGDMPVGELAARLALATDSPRCREDGTFETSDVGGLDVACLRKRWHEAVEYGDVGDMPVGELAGRLTLATDSPRCGEDGTFETSDVGGLDVACLRKRWHEAVEYGDVGDMPVSELAGRLTLATDLPTCSEDALSFGKSDVGGLDSACLRKRWHEEMEFSDVGDMPVSELAGRLTLATDLPTWSEDALSFGKSDVGGLDAACLRKRWHEAMEFSDVGDMPICEIAPRLTLATGRQGVGGMPSVQLEERWQLQEAKLLRESGCSQANRKPLLSKMGARTARGCTVEDLDVTSNCCILQGQAVRAATSSAGGHGSAPVG